MKNNRASGILKLIAALRSMAKSKSLALKSKTNAIKARLVIFSLVMNKRYVMSTISDKFQSLLGHHHSHLKEVEDGNDSVEDKCTVVINDNAHLHEDFVSTSSLQASIGSSIVSTSERCEIFGHTRKAVSNVNPSETQMVVEDNDGADDDDGCECFYTYGDDDDDDDDGGGGGNKYPDLTHTMFESDDLEIGGSVIDLVKSSKEEAGQEFKMEDEIDHMADLFIRKFRRQIMLQKQDSLKRNEMQIQ
ncbi:hypothetical protein AAZX31_02G064200 [Glycine max]|uniref:Uncharacterized protein n=1 Tax=Glycine max TaxID=3847 RepID=I1JD17_SOYBN|nr:uncharacterized protein LOC100780939 [Glycine max]KAG5079314.1 hypothetical protein JHK86_003379 [Glycine max]KAH1059090.1 hypothetical protein GYH30_003240 [Glycine max]KRH70096.1 hypothetical protein GLYMA_02G068200v4 [Glycine max]|eukprot:XP_003519939.1 uncharacterized protein LOC100780939 [Glycine max]